MFFSIVIPTCNRNELLCKCLDLLSKSNQSIKGEVYEVIVSDDSKTNSAKKIIQERYPWVIWTEGPKRGPASNRNNGAKVSNGSWIVFLDDDCEPDPSLLQTYKDLIITYPNVDVFEGAIEVDRERISPLEYAPINTSGGHLWSCNFAIRKSKFIDVGGFDEVFCYPHMEDIDLRDRLVQTQSILEFARTAKVIHPWRKLADGKKIGRYQEMYIYYHIKHNKKYSLINLLLEITRVHLALLKGTIFNRDFFTGVRIWLEHILTVINNFKKWEKKYVGKFKS